MGILISDKVSHIADSVVHLTDCAVFQNALKQIYTIVSPALWPVSEVDPASCPEDIYDTTVAKYLQSIDALTDDSGKVKLT